MNPTRRLTGLVWLALILAATLGASLFIGSRPIVAAQMWAALWHPGTDPISTVVWESRVPRTLVALAAGAALGVAGSVMQAVTRNPMTDPGILGVNAGAAFGVVIAMTLFHQTSILGYVWFAFVGSALAAVVVFLVGNLGPLRGSPVRITLAGVALGAILSGFTSAILLTNPAVFAVMRSWSAGTTASTSMTTVVVVAPVIATGLVIALASSRALDVLALGEASAVAMGAHPTRIRGVSLVAITLLAGGATAATGPISFIGLLAAHLARGIVGPHMGWIIAYTAIGAPIILTVSDILARVIVPGEAPVGIITAFVGAPLLIALARRHHVSEA